MNSRLDVFMKIFLWICIIAAVGGVVAWALGREGGAFVILIAMGISAFPLFHFAMDWPLNEAKRSAEDPRQKTGTTNGTPPAPE